MWGDPGAMFRLTFVAELNVGYSIITTVNSAEGGGAGMHLIYAASSETFSPVLS